MITRILRKTIIPMTFKHNKSFNAISGVKFGFGSVKKPQSKRPIRLVIEDQIKAEHKHLNNLASYQKQFSSADWSLNHQNTLVQLSKKTGLYHIRLLSHIQPPNVQQEKLQGQEQAGQSNEVSIYVTKEGSEKTMVINTVVTRGFQLMNIHFAQTYQQAKLTRLSIMDSNNYIGPSLERLSNGLLSLIYYLLTELGISNELMETFADYCLQSEQKFYIQWLRDLASIV